MTMPKSVDDLSRVLQQVLQRAEGAYPDQAHRVWEVWDQAVGPEVAERCRPLSLRSGRLTVAVTNAAWMQQLSFVRDSLRDAVNRALGVTVVKEVRLRMAEADPPPPPPRRPPAPPPWLA
jgi:predicted nucleic acid-binding Zn ribbon protein